jgi:hypothetical protein
MILIIFLYLVASEKHYNSAVSQDSHNRFLLFQKGLSEGKIEYRLA